MVNSKKKETKVLPLKKKTSRSTDIVDNLPPHLKALQEAIDKGSYNVKVTDLVSSFLSKDDELNEVSTEKNKLESDEKSSDRSLKILKK